MTESHALPLDGLLVLDLSLFLAGPYAALRLQDMGARVIKIERPDGGDPCRDLYKTGDGGGESVLFHTINRGKESIAVDLKEDAGRSVLFDLIRKADVIIQNYRPGVAERLGLGYDAVAEVNPRIVYASISGYGAEGPWAHLPGQDLLAQARSGITWLTGNAGDPPLPTGLAVADIFAGATAVQGILAALVGRGIGGRGRLVETSLLECLIDLQLEMISEHLNRGGGQPERTAFSNANVYAPAPYGIYETGNGHIAIAMNPLDKLSDLLDLPALSPLIADQAGPHRNRDEIKRLVAERLAQKTTEDWLSVLQPADIWCAEVLQWNGLFETEQFAIMDMLQTLDGTAGERIETTRIPLRFNGVRPKSSAPAPSLGADGPAIRGELAG